MIRIGLTLGDPAGIGPEVTRSALMRCLRDEAKLRYKLYGSKKELELFPKSQFIERSSVGEFRGPKGEASEASGAQSFEALRRAINDVKQGILDGIVTAPISKEAWRMCGLPWPGHTEILGKELGVGPVAMAFFGQRLKIVLSTSHLAHREVSSNLSVDRIYEVGRLLSEALEGLGLESPKLAMAALNPHASENGQFGDEERRVLEPAARRLQKSGIDIGMPVPADAVFRLALDGRYAGVVAHYHDQALIPIKLVEFGAAANVTLGLSTVRTSPDHGTAFDIAGQGSADASGMLAAIGWAQKLCLQKVQV